MPSLQVMDTKVDEDMKRLRATGFGNSIELCEEDFTTKKNGSGNRKPYEENGETTATRQVVSPF